MKTLIIAITLFLGSFAMSHGDHAPLAAHLSFKQDTLHIHATFQVTPKVGEDSRLLLEVKNAETHEAVDLAETIEVVLWMPDMGHGSSPTTVEAAVDENGNVIPGTFNVYDVYFTMGGQWEVSVTSTDADGVQETQSFLVTLKGAHH